MTRADWPRVAEIYAEGIATGGAGPPSRPRCRPGASGTPPHLPAPRPVVRMDGRIVGWGAVVALVSPRRVFAGRVECSLYVAEGGPRHARRRAPHGRAGARVGDGGVWTLEAVVFPDNVPSIAMLGTVGFRVVGARERIARLHGRWRDVLLLERRGRVVSRASGGVATAGRRPAPAAGTAGSRGGPGP